MVHTGRWPVWVGRGTTWMVAPVIVAGLGVVAATDVRGWTHGIVDGLARIGFWGLVLVVSARIGAWIVDSTASGITHLAWDGAVGLPVLIAGWLVVGLFPGGFRPATIVAVLTLFGFAALACAWRDPSVRFRASLDSNGAAWVLPAVALLVAIGLTWNRVPVLFYDSLAYHYAQPELWLLNRRIAAESWSLHSWFPPGMSVLYGAGLALGGESLANDANLLVGTILALLTFDLARRLWGAAAGVVALAQLLAFPQVIYALAIPAADLGHGTFAGATLGALYAAGDDFESVWVRRAAWLAGGAVLTKYLGFLTLGIGVAWLLVGRRRREGTSFRRTLGASLRWAAPASLLIMPWLVENTIAVGNPVAPVLESVFPARGLSPGGAERFRSDAHGGLPHVDDLRQLLPELVTGSEDSSRLYPTPAWGWTIVALGPVLLLSLKHRNVLRLLLLGTLTFGIWFLTFRWERFLVSTTFLLAVAAGGANVLVWRRGGVARGLPVAVALVAVISLVSAGQEIVTFTGGLPVALGRESPRSFLRRSFPTAGFYEEVAAGIDRDSSCVLLLGDARHFRLGVKRVAPSVFNIHPLAEALARSRDLAECSRELRSLGFTHILVDLGWVNHSAAMYPSLAVFHDHPDLLLEYLASLGSPVLRHGALALFTIPAS